jgi:hypothetical protein
MKHKRTRRLGFYGAIAVLVLLQVWIFVGHYYRYPFEKQFEPWHDGIALNEVDEGYPHIRSESDTFSEELYESVRSVEDAVVYLRARYDLSDDEAVLKGVYELVSNRYIHFMYPHFTWLTNPYLSLVEKVVPEKPYNGMYLADDMLRHGAAGGCGNTATTFIEIYRALGREAQFVELPGHDVAEAVAGGKKWLVDPDMGGIAPQSVADINMQTDLLDGIYEHQGHKVGRLKEMFGSDRILEYGYDSLPTASPRIYRAQQVIGIAKWMMAPALIALLILMRRRILPD